MKRALLARQSLPLSSAVTERVRDIERVRGTERERERERESERERLLRVCVCVRLRGALDAGEHWMLERSSATKDSL